jgi:hypothetical protein
VCKIFEIEDQVMDWPVVDEHFFTLYRRIHNGIVRAKGGI